VYLFAKFFPFFPDFLFTFSTFFDFSHRSVSGQSIYTDLLDNIGDLLASKYNYAVKNRAKL